ncbi:hypothetical protein R6Z07F_009740 [Ovis aries]
MNWQRCSGQLLALVTNYPNSRHFLLHRHRRTTDHAPRFRTRDPITPAFLQEMLSIASPQPPRQAPKAPSCSRARGSRPWESDPPLGSRRARWQQAGRAARAPGSRGCLRSGAVLAPLPLRARPVPKEDTPPPAGRLPTLRGAASRARPPARPRWPRAAPAASERGERSGMGLGGSGQGGDSGSASGFFPGSHERSPRGEPWLSERRRGQRGRPGRLRPCLASQAPAAAAAAAAA